MQLTSSGSCTSDRASRTATATTTPAARPPTAASRKCSTASPREKPPLVAAVTATVSVVSAVASLSRPSPSMIVISRAGRPTWPPTASAATRSVGATAAPSATPAARPRPGPQPQTRHRQVESDAGQQRGDQHQPDGQPDHDAQVLADGQQRGVQRRAV